MKQFKIILGLILLASVTTFAQSPRIKLNQITKDTVKGSVLISNPTDSGMVYSRDFYIAYGADTLLILYGDTIGGVGGGVNSIVVDPITLNGNGTIASPLSVDTATVISTIQGLVDSLANYVTTNTTQTISGAKTFTAAFTQSGGDANFDSGTFYVDATNNRLKVNGTYVPDLSPANRGKIEINGSESAVAFRYKGGFINESSDFGSLSKSTKSTNKRIQYIFFDRNDVQTGKFGVDVAGSDDDDFQIIAGSGSTAQFHLEANGNVGIGTTSPSEKLDVDGNGRFRSIGSGASAGALHYTSTGVLTTNTSDARLKTNLQPLENTLNKLLGINTYTFNWIDETERVDLGMVAQEVEQIFPNLVFTNSVDGYKGIHYDKFSSILTKAIQEQQAIIETQQTEIDQLKTLITDLTNRLTILENK